MQPRDKELIFDVLYNPFDGHDLTPEQNQAAVMYAKGCTGAQIAEELGITEEAVRLRLNHARRKLKVKSSREMTLMLFRILEDTVKNL